MYVDAVGLTLVSQSSPDFFDSVGLPTDLSFLHEIDPESSLFTIVISGDGLDGNVPIDGDIDDLDGNPEPVPEPASFAMLAIGVAGLLGLKGAQRCM